MSDEPTAEFEIADKTKIWEAFWQTDPSKTKSFSRAGGFKGTAINPTYVKERLTTFFGPIGLGWGYKVIDEELIKGHKEGDNQFVVHKVLIEFWYLFGKRRSEPIQAFGQTTMVGTNKNGWYTDEEAPKKSLTDALTKAASDLGMSADIHAGLYDDCKYVAEVRAKFSKTEKPENGSKSTASASAAPANGEKMASDPQIKKLAMEFKKLGFSDEERLIYLFENFEVGSSKELTMKQASDLITRAVKNGITRPIIREEPDDIPF